MEVNSDDFCRVLSFLSHLAELLSACFTVHFTLQRFIAVKFPLSVFMEKNIHYLHYLIVTVFILFGFLYCLALIVRNAYDNCEEELYLSWFISDALLSFAVPFTIIAVLNLLIILQLRATLRVKKHFLFQQTPRQENVPLHPKKRSLPSYDAHSQSKVSENTTVLHGKVRTIQAG